MGLFDKMSEPVFLKESSSSKEQLEKLEAALDIVPEEIKSQIEQDIKLLAAGVYGEDQIAFELKNSHMPMFILHDLFLSDGDLTAQIDYLIITRKRHFILECKNLYGNIEINVNGDFIRTTEYKGKIRKEGIYSPITQNQRHLELLKKIRREAKGNVITKTLFDKNFYDNYRSVVVLANPKTILNAKYAKKETKDQVIRVDQLVQYIKKVNNEKDAYSQNDKEMEQLANYYLDLHSDNPKDYLEKYNLPKHESVIIKEQEEVEINVQEEEISIEETKICPKCGAPMVKRIAKRGDKVGNEFWGCTNFPKCREIQNIGTDTQPSLEDQAGKV